MERAHFYRQDAKRAKFLGFLGVLGDLAVVQYHPDEYSMRGIHLFRWGYCLWFH